MVTLKNWSNGFIALAHLMNNDLVQARLAVDVAVRHDEPENNPNVRPLLGIIFMRQGDKGASEEAFQAALGQAQALLQHTPHNYNALDAMGVALAGLALCGQQGRDRDAIAAHAAARATNRDTGVIARVLRLYETMAPVDNQSLLNQVREAARGDVKHWQGER